ncbi:Coq4 family protein [Aerosakkonemataceae cyanobacterium BLCC-F154]|uniref:Coq4 family protein n=1 Tax=Floridaenema fluviatile BLCC-F154 TaxID=3153640 RepID=A0ABV4Y8F0_9CYAN
MFLKDRQRRNIDYLQTLKGVVALLRDPGQTDSVYDVEEGLRNIKAVQLSVDFVKSKPEVAAIIEERYLAPEPDMEALLKLPEESLGYAYASYLKEAGFDPNFYRKLEVVDDASYMFLRIRQSHDIWHIVTGMNTDVIGELGLKAFELAQTRRPMSLVLLTGGLMRTLLSSPEDLDLLLDRIAVGYRMGAKAKPFLAQKWEENWEKPLAEWQAELGVEPTPVYVP